MKKNLLYILSLLFLFSCENKDLCYNHPHYNDILVFIHWDSTAVKSTKGMRTNFFLLEGNYVDGCHDMGNDGGRLKMPYVNSYTSYCYDYDMPEKVYVRNENDESKIEAYTNSAKRTSYSLQYPDEELILCPDRFYVDCVTPFDVIKKNDTLPQELHFYPKNVVETYTIEIRGVKGVQYLTSLAGSVSGVSGSYFIGKQSASDDMKTVIFDADPSKETQSIVGEFRIFGHCVDGHNKNYLTMEVRYPSGDPNNGYKTATWDVTDQMHNGTHHIIIDWNIEIIPTISSGSGFDADVLPWDEVWIPITI